MSAGAHGSARNPRSATGLAPQSPATHQPTGPGHVAPAPVAPAPAASTPATPTPTTATAKTHHRHHVLIEPEEDRWAWRRRIRQNPHQLRIYRVGIGIAGLLLICLGLITGPLPGPGGIPLVLLGLAVWSSEFEWAYRLRQRFKAWVRKFRGWSPRRKVVFWVAFFAACASFGYSYLLILGVPFWVPDVGAHLLDRLPGVHATG